MPNNDDEITFEFLEQAFAEGGGGIGEIMDSMERAGTLKMLYVKNARAFMALGYYIDKLSTNGVDDEVAQSNKYGTGTRFDVNGLKQKYDRIHELVREAKFGKVAPVVEKALAMIDEIIPGNCSRCMVSKCDAINRVSNLRDKLEDMFCVEVWLLPPFFRKRVKDYVGYHSSCNSCWRKPCGLYETVNMHRGALYAIKTIIKDLV